MTTERMLNELRGEPTSHFISGAFYIFCIIEHLTGLNMEHIVPLRFTAPNWLGSCFEVAYKSRPEEFEV